MKQCRLGVFDPPMCCSSGVCGPDVDPELVKFAQSLDWLRKQQVEVERHNLSSNPGAFVEHEAIRKALEENGLGCLPLIVVNGLIVHGGSYLERDELARICEVEG